MFAKELPAKLPAEARQGLAHDVDHGLGRPAIATIVEEGEGEHLTIYRRHVPSQCNDIIGCTRFGVQVSLGGGVPHAAPEKL